MRKYTKHQAATSHQVRICLQFWAGTGTESWDVGLHGVRDGYRQISIP